MQPAIPASLLISADPREAAKILNKNTTTTTTTRNYEIYSRTQPKSKRPNHSQKAELERKSKKKKKEALGLQLRAELPTLPPTPLTPREIIQSTTLSRSFKKSNRVFSQIADSTTDLIQSDSNTSNQLNELAQLLRGDLSSRSWIDVIQGLIQKPHTTNPQEEEDHNYQILTQTLETIQGLFVTNQTVNLPIIGGTSSKTKPDPRSSSSSEHLDPNQQLECLEESSIIITKFLGDLNDYRDRLFEIRNGCLAIEKRRRAIWNLIKLSNVAFDRSIVSTSTTDEEEDSSLSNSDDQSSSDDDDDDDDDDGLGSEHDSLSSSSGSNNDDHAGCFNEEGRSAHSPKKNTSTTTTNNSRTGPTGKSKQQPRNGGTKQAGYNNDKSRGKRVSGSSSSEGEGEVDHISPHTPPDTSLDHHLHSHIGFEKLTGHKNLDHHHLLSSDSDSSNSLTFDSLYSSSGPQLFSSHFNYTHHSHLHAPPDHTIIHKKRRII
ncbi:hypothetical protein PSTG_01297 [Puccinia striiformis f. sp. tritici PST-78]|uniref:Transcriptional regulatory protein RXT2 N-terminal domain-containing protein n=1 Tax=Puccinia striiformis f. sp. tritici PST-78 TaxID=1165861 RepID=A0A0L0W1W1_9BASI|nr:hypothetical protein PSTG_01297 [Puccinia striiformis f. sp. tritici PST-78]